MALLELRRAGKSFGTARGTREVLGSVDFAVDEGEFVSVVGYSGSGKTTLINLLSGLAQPSHGEVLLRGEKLNGFAPDASIVFQNYSLLPWFSSFENVRLAIEAAHPDWPASRQKEQAEKYLSMVGLSGALHKKPRQLSGGMRQRVSIARAFAVEPAVMFLDEPFGALDALTRATLQAELASLCSQAGRTVTAVMVTNSVEEAILLSDRIVPMSKGPAATLGPAVAVDLPRPRSVAELSHDPAAIAIEAKLIDYLSSIDPKRAKASSALTPQNVLEGALA